MDELLQKAIERRDYLRAELEAVESFIRNYGQVRERQDPTPSKEQFSLFRSEAGKRAKHAAAVRAMIDFAERIILEEGHPLTRGQLVRRIEQAGHRIVGGDKNKVFGTNMWRSGRFWNIKGAGYWPRNVPVPSGYEHLERRA